MAQSSPRGWIGGAMRVVSGAIACSVLLALSSVAPTGAAERVEKTFGKWTVRCVEAGERPKNCSMFQSVVGVTQQTKQRRLLLRWAISRNDNNEMIQRLVVPAGVSVKEGIRLFIGEGEPTVIPYDICGPRVCFGEAPVDAKRLAAVKADEKVSANYVRGSKQLAQVQLDLTGFGEAYNFLAQQLS